MLVLKLGRMTDASGVFLRCATQNTVHRTACTSHSVLLARLLLRSPLSYCGQVELHHKSISIFIVVALLEN